MRRHRPEPHTLSGAYALDALSDSDRAQFERHLARCPACKREVTELREATTGLARASSAAAPPALIERVLKLAGQVRQVPPAIGHPATRGIGSASRARTPRRLSSRTLRRLSSRSLPRLAGALAVVLLAAWVVLGALAWRAEDEVSAGQQRAQQIATVLNAPDAVMRTDQIRTGGSATVIMSGRDHQLVFTSSGLAQLPAGRCYQLWLMGPAGDRSAGMLPSPHDGMTRPVIASGIRARDRVALTIEPEGGTSHPTRAPILVMPL